MDDFKTKIVAFRLVARSSISISERDKPAVVPVYPIIWTARACSGTGKVEGYMDARVSNLSRSAQAELR